MVLDRPPLNVVTMRERDQLRAVFEALDRDPGVRVIVLRGEGKHFSSGGDIRGFLDSTPERVSELARNVAAPERCHKPVVAAIRGYCFGVGFELSLACDFRIVSETAELALPEQRIGMIPGSGGSARLVRMIGIARTKDVAMRSPGSRPGRPTSGASPSNAYPTRSSKRGPMRSSTSKLLAPGPAHAEGRAERRSGLAAPRRHRAGGTGLRPAALLGRFSRGCRVVLRQAQARLQGDVIEPARTPCGTMPERGTNSVGRISAA